MPRTVIDQRVRLARSQPRSLPRFAASGFATKSSNAWTIRSVSYGEARALRGRRARPRPWDRREQVAKEVSLLFSGHGPNCRQREPVPQEPKVLAPRATAGSLLPVPGHVRDTKRPPVAAEAYKPRRCAVRGRARQDSNLGPTDYESAALTAELRARPGGRYRFEPSGAER